MAAPLDSLIGAGLSPSPYAEQKALCDEAFRILFVLEGHFTAYPVEPRSALARIRSWLNKAQEAA